MNMGVRVKNCDDLWGGYRNSCFVGKNGGIKKGAGEKYHLPLRYFKFIFDYSAKYL